MTPNARRTLGLVLGLIVICEGAGCGYLLHPERRGQRGGSIDPGIAVLDGVGLLLFVIPGIIAYAVDFATGTIYLPNTSRGGAPAGREIRRYTFDPRHDAQAAIDRIVREHAGVDLAVERDRVTIRTLGSLEEMRRSLAQFAAGPRPDVLVSAGGR